LPPSWSDAWNSSQLAWSTISSDVKAVVLPVVVSNGLGNFIKPELLVFSIVSPSLKYNIGTSEHFSNSVEWKLWNKIEWSVNVESKFFIQTFSGSLLSFVKVKNLPFLVGFSSITPNTNLGSFFVFWLDDIKHFFVGPVNELTIFILENLEPTWVSAPNLHVVGLSRTLNVPWLIV
jgi:hypothetical protein